MGKQKKSEQQAGYGHDVFSADRGFKGVDHPGHDYPINH